jgi:hypothetical protein
VPTPTYDLLYSTTLGATTASVTLSGISGSYGDLILRVQGGGSGGGPVSFEIYPNGSTSNGSMVYMENFNNSTGSGTYARLLFTLDAQDSLAIIQFMDYASSKHKPILARYNNPNRSTNYGVSAYAGRWANTSAITSIQLTDAGGQTFDAGTTFYLWGIAK